MAPKAPIPSVLDTAVMARPPIWLPTAACLLVAATFVLVALGGVVTSNEWGLAVPDGWLTFGDLSLFAPLATWWNDPATRGEHLHRIMGSLVGLLTLAVAGGLIATGQGRPWRLKLAITLVLMVIAQGEMGAMRVDAAEIQHQGVGVAATGTETPWSTLFRILHGIIGQVFLCLTVLTAAALGGPWHRAAVGGRAPDAVGRKMTRLCFWLWVAFLIQLTLGASVRHTGSALAIPDFPGHYGGLIPPTSQATLNAALDARGIDHPFALWQVHLHLAHRLFAVVVVAKVAMVLWLLIRRMHWPDLITGPAVTIVSLLVIQVVLGITVVLSAESPMVATTHQVVGAILLASATWLIIRVAIAARDPGTPAAATSSPGLARLQGGAA